MYKSYIFPGYPECQVYSLISGVRNKTPIPVEDHLAKYVSAAQLAGMAELTTYLAEEKPAYKARGTLKGKYLDPRTDFGAKKIFSNDILLKSFFNCLLEGYTTVNKVNMTPTEALGETKEDKSVIFDVSFKNEKNERFLFEMQKQRQPWFMERSQYYTTFPIRDQVFKGEEKYKFTRIYSIGVLNFNLKKEDMCLQKPEDVKDVLYKNVCGKIIYIYIQLPKFIKKEHELEGGLDKWLYALKNIHRLTERPEILFEEEFKLLFDMMETANLTPLEMEQYLLSLKSQMDRENMRTYDREEGKKEGKKEGREEGREERGFEIAKNLKENDTPNELISKYTGLTMEQIQRL